MKEMTFPSYGPVSCSYAVSFILSLRVLAPYSIEVTDRRTFGPKLKGKVCYNALFRWNVGPLWAYSWISSNWAAADLSAAQNMRFMDP